MQLLGEGILLRPLRLRAGQCLFEDLLSQRLRSRLCSSGLRIFLAFSVLIRLCLRELVRETN